MDGTGLVDDETGLFNDGTGLVDDETGLFNDGTGLVTVKQVWLMAGR